MKTIITTIEELKNIILEILFSKTDKVNKVSSTSIINALAYGIAKIGQKALKDIALIEAQLFPEYATGEYLDLVAARYGIFERLGACSSTTYLFISGTPNTYFDKDKVSFTSNDGITFLLEDSVTIPNCKYVYAKVKSENTGLKTNVAPLSIVNCINPPSSGFDFCINEFMAVGGRDTETDEELLYRIENIHNSLSTKTLEYLTQIALRFQPDILKFVHLGTKLGKTKLGIYTQSGCNLTDSQLATLRTQMQGYLSISDISDEINSRVVFSNVGYSTIDLSFKIEYMTDKYSINEIYLAIQRKLNNFVDFRYWDINKNVQWSDLYSLVRNTEGILSVPYADFKVNGGHNDIEVNINLLPRFRSCLIYDINGNSLLDINMVNNMPVIYPIYADNMFNVYND